MKQRTSSETARPLHVALIMDGNGRWATARHWPRIAGHRAGGEVVRRVVEAAPALSIGTLTLYAFSSDNWRRPRREVGALMELLGDYVRAEIARCVREGVRISFIGRRDRLPEPLVLAMRTAESATSSGSKVHLRLAIDYSARDAILKVVQRLAPGAEPTREDFLGLLSEIESPGAAAPEVDLLIRTGGEQRLSDFLLWESAYAELHFTETMWPDFGARELEAAVREFHARHRRFGALPKQAAG